MKKKLAIAFLLAMYVMASALTYVTFRRYPDHSGAAVLQWLLFYIVTAVYPPIWTCRPFVSYENWGSIIRNHFDDPHGHR
jgi:hypothetical protein